MGPHLSECILLSYTTEYNYLLYQEGHLEVVLSKPIQFGSGEKDLIRITAFNGHGDTWTRPEVEKLARQNSADKGLRNEDTEDKTPWSLKAAIIASGKEKGWEKLNKKPREKVRAEIAAQAEIWKAQGEARVKRYGLPNARIRRRAQKAIGRAQDGQVDNLGQAGSTIHPVTKAAFIHAKNPFPDLPHDSPIVYAPRTDKRGELILGEW